MFPSLNKKISGLCEKRKEEFYRGRMEILKEQAKEIILREAQDYNSIPTIEELKRRLHLESQFYTKYREVYEYIVEIRESVLYTFNRKV